MSITGLAGLLSSQTTREVKLACGLSLVFVKQRLKHIVAREEEIMRLRGSIGERAEEIARTFSKITDQNVRKTLLDALLSATREIIMAPKYALFGEDSDFTLSPYGKAYQIFVLTRENTDWVSSVDDIRQVQEAFLTEDELTEIDAAIDWACEVELLKNSNSLQVTEGTPANQSPAKEPSNDGDS